MVVALRGQTGPSSAHPHEFLPWKVHPWLLLHCPGFALTFLSYNRVQSWERGPLPHFLPAQLWVVWDGTEGAVLESSAPQLFSQLGLLQPRDWQKWIWEAKTTDQEIDCSHLASTECTEKGNFCNSQDIFTNNLQFKCEFGAYMDGSWLIAERSFYYGICSTTWLPSWEFRRGNFGERM